MSGSTRVVKIWNFWHGSFKNCKKFLRAADFFSKGVRRLGHCVVDRRDLRDIKFFNAQIRQLNRVSVKLEFNTH